MFRSNHLKSNSVDNNKSPIWSNNKVVYLYAIRLLLDIGLKSKDDMALCYMHQYGDK